MATSTTNQPVEFLPQDVGREPEDLIGLCLSGGGYRAMLFHAGSLLRLHEMGVLAKIDRISSVSGGSITAGVLALVWPQVAGNTNRATFMKAVVEPIKRMASETIDGPSVLGGIFLPGTISSRIADAYDEHLFHGKTLQDLPNTPIFTFNATNLESGSLWRFRKAYMRDWRVGMIKSPKLRLAQAVAASSAFPPVLSPFELGVVPSDFAVKEPGLSDDFRRDIALSDGGVYDNLGLETIWKKCKTVLVSDAGGLLAPDPSPPGDWARQSVRVLDVIDQQVRNLRKRQIMDSFTNNIRQGAYWGIRSNIADYPAPNALPAPHDRTLALAETPTRLKRLDADDQERLINWGYAICDAAVRRWYDNRLAASTGYPSSIGV